MRRDKRNFLHHRVQANTKSLPAVLREFSNVYCRG